MKRKRTLSVVVCAALALGVFLSLVVVGAAEPECTCKITVHGSNCPLSACTCGQLEHEESCPLYGQPDELTHCGCAADTHAEGCPLYEAKEAFVENETLEATILPEPETEIPQQPEPHESSEAFPAPGQTPKPTLSEAPETETYLLVYSLHADDKGELSFTEATVAKGEAIGVENIPLLSLPEGYKLEAYIIDAEAYSASQLAEFVPEADVMIEVRTVEIDPIEEEDPAIEDPEEGDTTDWEYPPGWAGSGQKYIKGNLLAASECKTLDIALAGHIAQVMDVVGITNSGRIREDPKNLCAVFAAYAALSGQTEDFPYGLTIETKEDAEILRNVYWSMTQVVGVSNTKGETISVRRLGISEATDVLKMSGTQAEQAQALITESNKAKINELLEGSILTALTDEEFTAIEERLPAGISSERRAVLTAALALEGKVEYFWGGKSYYVGWDDRWGEMRRVTDIGSSTYGTARPMGMDCSGFVSWAFINAAGDKSTLPYVGNGTANQYLNSKAIAWNKVQPGDLLFYKTPSAQGTNHVGIVLSVNSDGTPKEVIHCSSSKNGVVVTDAVGFNLARRPYLYNEQ
ncbi:C40 family peptidase [Christensenella intestinihominis]|uniref:C40 family peptidase n=1 Tax=Christensenella intestinihominis TaxID=1851429 RepID=UPI000837A724|nr:NlpC/P60 family protein [Christensenella intestinihominis]